VSPCAVRGLNGSRAFAFMTSVKHGGGKRDIEVLVDPGTITQLAAAMEACPKNKDEYGWVPGHVVWHYDHPDRGACGP
jgi:hypothetical protein